MQIYKNIIIYVRVGTNAYIFEAEPVALVHISIEQTSDCEHALRRLICIFLSLRAIAKNSIYTFSSTMELFFTSNWRSAAPSRDHQDVAWNGVRFSWARVFLHLNYLYKFSLSRSANLLSTPRPIATLSVGHIVRHSLREDIACAYNADAHQPCDVINKLSISCSWICFSLFLSQRFFKEAPLASGRFEFRRSPRACSCAWTPAEMCTQR